MVLTVRERGARAARPVAIELSNDALKCFCMLISWTTGEPPNTVHLAKIQVVGQGAAG